MFVDLRKKVVRVVVLKCLFVVRVDSFYESIDGFVG